MFLLAAGSPALVAVTATLRRAAAARPPPRMAEAISEALSELCLLLPSAEFPGDAPALLAGDAEVELAEMEDSCESRSQLHLCSDGRVSVGQTDGPPPVSTCGVWQCGSDEFQMVIQRTFATQRFGNYRITRVYRGAVNPDSSGINLVQGQMGFHPDAMEDELPAGRTGGLFEEVARSPALALSGGRGSRLLTTFRLAALGWVGRRLGDRLLLDRRQHFGGTGIGHPRL